MFDIKTNGLYAYIPYKVEDKEHVVIFEKMYNPIFCKWGYHYIGLARKNNLKNDLMRIKLRNNNINLYYRLNEELKTF